MSSKSVTTSTVSLPIYTGKHPTCQPPGRLRQVSFLPTVPCLPNAKTIGLVHCGRTGSYNITGRASGSKDPKDPPPEMTSSVDIVYSTIRSLTPLRGYLGPRRKYDVVRSCQLNIAIFILYIYLQTFIGTLHGYDPWYFNVYEKGYQVFRIYYQYVAETFPVHLPSPADRHHFPPPLLIPNNTHTDIKPSVRTRHTCSQPRHLSFRRG